MCPYVCVHHPHRQLLLHCTRIGSKWTRNDGRSRFQSGRAHTHRMHILYCHRGAAPCTANATWKLPTLVSAPLRIVLVLAGATVLRSSYRHTRMRPDSQQTQQTVSSAAAATIARSGRIERSHHLCPFSFSLGRPPDSRSRAKYASVRINLMSLSHSMLPLPLFYRCGARARVRRHTHTHALSGWLVCLIAFFRPAETELETG